MSRLMQPSLVTYTWGDKTLSVVASDKVELAGLVHRLGSVTPVGEMKSSIPLDLVPNFLPGSEKLVKIWTKGLRSSSAMVAIGLTEK